MTVGTGLLTRPSGIHGIPECDTVRTGSVTVGRGLAPAAVFRFAKNRSPTKWAITPPTLRATSLINEGGKFAARDGVPLARSCGP